MSKEVMKGKMNVTLKNENGMTLTQEHGFTIDQESKGFVLGFDLYEDHPELGTALLFGNQVFALGFWDDEDLVRAADIILKAVTREQERRNTSVGSGGQAGAKPGQADTEGETKTN